MKSTVMHWNYFAFTHEGKAHEQNEDRILIDNQVLESGSAAGAGEGKLFTAICDGIGSEAGGAKAASIAVEYFRTMEKDTTSIYAVSEAAMTINNSLCHMQKMVSDCQNMSTTIAGLSVLGNCFLAFNIGDTRIYMNRRDGFRQISKDHTHTAARAAGKRRCCVGDIPVASRNIVTHYLGGKQNVWFPALYRGTLHQEAVVFLLCSDGIYKKLNNCELSGIIRSSGAAEEKCRAIVDRAVHNGSTDDMSIALVEIEVRGSSD